MNPRRREMLVALAVLGADVPLASAQQKAHRIGLVANSIPAADLASGKTEVTAPRIIREGLRDLGWVDGKNVQLIWKTVEGRFERWPAVIEEFVRMPVDVIVVFNSGAAKAALSKTRTIPIVHASFGSLLPGKLVDSLSRPGGNLTGISMDGVAELGGKQLELLKAAAPRVNRVAFIEHWDNRREDSDLQVGPETAARARSVGATMFVVTFRDRGQVEAAFAEAMRKGANGVIVGSAADMWYRDMQHAIHEQALRHRLPAMYQVLSAAETGGLMAYGVNIDEIYRGAPRVIDKILRGAKPSEIPIEQPSKFELVINRRTAKAIGLTIPHDVLTQADRVID